MKAERIWSGKLYEHINVGDTIYSGVAYDVLSIEDGKLICETNEFYRETEDYAPERRAIGANEVWGLLLNSKELSVLLNRIQFRWEKDLSQEDLLTPSHSKFKCRLKYKGRQFTCNFQCNEEYYSNYFTPEGGKKFKENVIRCCVLDYYSYKENQGLNEFARCFGYDDIEGCVKAFNACKHTYEELQRLFTEREIYSLDKYFYAKECR